MGCFASRFQSNNEEAARTRIQSSPPAPARSNSHPCHHHLHLESVVKELGSLSCNAEQGQEEILGHPRTTSEPFTQQENPTEGCQSNKRITFQEINLLDQSPKPVQTLSTKKIQLVAPCDQQKNPDQQIMPTTDPRNNSISCQNTPCQITPGTGSCKQTRACNLDRTLGRNDSRVLISDPNSPYLPVKDSEMQILEALPSLYKETPVDAKHVNPDLKHTQQNDIFSVIELVELKNEDEVAGECCSQPNKCYSETPAAMVSDLSKWLNGIPNTTTKYKEDQRVKWRATPFEERLERILSDEKMPPPRKLVSGRLIQLE